MKTNDTDIYPNADCPWLVMYSNSGNTAIVELLKAKQQCCQETGIDDFFVPLEPVAADRGKPTAQQRFVIAGNYIFLKASKENAMRLRQEPPFDVDLRFLHRTSPTDYVCIPDEKIQSLRLAAKKLAGDVEYFVPSKKEIAAGDRVCILCGQFEGISGILESVKGHEGGSVIVTLDDLLAVRTPRIAVRDIQLLDLARVAVGNGVSYNSRAYKKMRLLQEDSERLLAQKQQAGQLGDEAEKEARLLLRRFAQLRPEGKIRVMHAHAIYNIMLALGETAGDLFHYVRRVVSFRDTEIQ